MSTLKHKFSNVPIIWLKRTRLRFIFNYLKFITLIDTNRFSIGYLNSLGLTNNYYYFEQVSFSELKSLIFSKYRFFIYSYKFILLFFRSAKLFYVLKKLTRYNVQRTQNHLKYNNTNSTKRYNIIKHNTLDTDTRKQIAFIFIAIPVIIRLK